MEFSSIEVKWSKEYLGYFFFSLSRNESECLSSGEINNNNNKSCYAWKISFQSVAIEFIVFIFSESEVWYLIYN